MKILRMILTAPIWVPIMLLGFLFIRLPSGSWLILTACWISGEDLEEIEAHECDCMKPGR